jgi:hypothetical protein
MGFIICVPLGNGKSGCLLPSAAERLSRFRFSWDPSIKEESYRRSSETSYDLHLHISAKSAIVLDKNAEIAERRKKRDKR